MLSKETLPRLQEKIIKGFPGRPMLVLLLVLLCAAIYTDLTIVIQA